jgi:hypothetical protein
MMLRRTEWAMRFATTYLDLRNGGVELSVLHGWGEELWSRCGHLDPADVARDEFTAGHAPASSDAAGSANEM